MTPFKMEQLIIQLIALSVSIYSPLPLNLDHTVIQ